MKTSAKSELARARFNLGLLCLHNFMYDLAIEFFEKAQADERLLSGRDYPMALWGAAMSTKWILWQNSDCHHHSRAERSRLTKLFSEII